MWPQSKVKFKEKAVKIEIKTLDLIYNIILKGRSHLFTFDDRLIRSLCSAHRKPLSPTAKDNPDATKTNDAASSFGVRRRLLTCPINSCQTNETTVVEESHHGLLVFLIQRREKAWILLIMADTSIQLMCHVISLLVSPWKLADANVRPLALGSSSEDLPLWNAPSLSMLLFRQKTFLSRQKMIF